MTVSAPKTKPEFSVVLLWLDFTALARLADFAGCCWEVYECGGAVQIQISPSPQGA